MNVYDSFFSILIYIIRQKKLPRIFFPKTLTEKIFYLKLRPNLELSKLRTRVSDRIRVRDYVSQKKQHDILIPLLWTGLNLSKQEWDLLPNKFVVKANHGSKMVSIVDKKNTTYESICDEIKKWQKIDYYKKGREWVYKNLPRTIIIEELLNFENGIPPDYKFFCINGRVEFVQVDLDRFSKHKRNIYTRDFSLTNVKYQFEIGDDIKKPALYEDAVKIAEQLSTEFDFIRVDLYILEDKIYFGELTNFPGNCLEKFDPSSFDEKMGLKLRLLKK
ncbi:ATP-grasp fold amidoligase family protein [uncultured Cedecea sp.]|uniref:ATP-grasp fold amidoligase family protein n=1 Tax=uncultured Cedecea sp. TaxID=988762 RepID=UPI002624CAFD|nr:ATP-grasp fold amidoligase family protein [uncultured Cedecea sp.]